jgi:hypothetical protein
MSDFLSGETPLISPDKVAELLESLYGAIDNRWFHVSGLVGESALDGLQSQALDLQRTQKLETISDPERDTEWLIAERDEFQLPAEGDIWDKAPMHYRLGDELRIAFNGVSHQGVLVFYQPGTMFPEHYDVKERKQKLKIAGAVNIYGTGIYEIHPAQGRPVRKTVKPGDIVGLLSKNPNNEDFISYNHRVLNPTQDMRIAHTIGIYSP